MIAPQKSRARLVPEEIERIFKEHHDLVYRAAYRVTGRADEAEDVLQTLFLRLLRRECPPDFSDGPKAYLHRAAVNIALDILRVRGRSVSTDDAALSIEDERPTQDRQHTSTEIQDGLRLALAQLSPRAAEIFILKHIEGCSNREIAKLVGASQGTVAVLLYRSRARLKKYMRAHFGETL
jgi:RNA polymerase sigma-70 factor, ECF subfamily